MRLKWRSYGLSDTRPGGVAARWVGRYWTADRWQVQLQQGVVPRNWRWLFSQTERSETARGYLPLTLLAGAVAVVLGCMLHRFAFQVRFKCSLGSNRLGAGTQLPKDDACQQTRVGLRYLSCFCTERDLETGFSTCFPGESNLCGIEVPVGKRNEHLFLRRPTVLLSCCPFRWWHGLTKHTLLKTIPLS
jgi:hypothetical protein